MTILSYTEICELIEDGVIENADYACVNSSSLDIHLGSTILLEGQVSQGPENLKYLNKKSHLVHETVILEDSPEFKGQIAMAPGEFLLASSREIFNLPNNISAEYKLKSSMARLGLDHLNAGWCDAGWNGSVLTLELKNVTQRHRIVLTVGDRIGQMVFYRHREVPLDKSYATRGSYNGDKTAQGVKTNVN
jgi:dCTP deaminase